MSNPTTDRYKELSILYGQEFEIIKWFSLDFFAGTGYVKFVFDERYKGVLSKEYTSKAIGFPIEGKIRFSPTAEFSLGLHYRKNYNSAIEIIESGIFLQMNF